MRFILSLLLLLSCLALVIQALTLQDARRILIARQEQLALEAAEGNGDDPSTWKDAVCDHPTVINVSVFWFCFVLFCFVLVLSS